MVNTYNRELNNGRNNESVTVYRSNGGNTYNRDLHTHTVKEYEVQCKNTIARDFTFGLTFGIAIGTLAGLLLAPKPGRDLKKDINSKVVTFKDSAVNNSVDKQGQPSKADEIKNKVTEKVSEVKEKAQEIKEQVVQKAGEVQEQVVQKANEIQEKVAEKAPEVKEQVAQKVGEVKEQATQKVNEVQEKVAEKAPEVKEQVAQKAGEVKEKAQDKKEEVKAKAEEKKEAKKEAGKSETTQAHSTIKVVEVDDRDKNNTDVKTDTQLKDKVADSDALAAQRRAIKEEVNDDSLAEPLAVVDKDTKSDIEEHKKNHTDVSGNVNKTQNNQKQNNNNNKNNKNNNNNKNNTNNNKNNTKQGKNK
ncbi:hypothetical protein ERX27_02190 [Macrococcus brunensis]|uniref:YtxH domain-containing protein n=1 Tax=Macrococcus brunensis TaxID=198483 RepID=A0A4R6BFH0_9STAP|nr:YtxH domain-containing protein [Macrococcus brunensis]TDL98607.1 hypothetical protein ERX27_02190 [Macrococcus brunensis]